MDNAIKLRSQRLLQGTINNKERSLRRDRRLVRDAFYTLLILCVMTCWCAGVASADGGLVKAHGKLTSVEEDGTVFINGEGYLMDSNTRIYNSSGNRCSLDELTIPAVVEFIYVFTSKGPIIRRIKELPR